ncbi:MAG: GNAT family N-acetyltransferase [Anaerolinea sp.]|nr:GNAT family N-acetyltransferase [Anaerolinea sp.]
MEINLFDHQAADDAAYAAYNTLSNTLRAERLPDLPPIPVVEQKGRLQSMPPFMGYSLFTVTDKHTQTMIAATEVSVPQMAENAHMVQFMIHVLPAYRRQGTGRLLLGRVAELAQGNGRHLLLSSSYGNIPAGAAFLERMGASRGLETHTNRLNLADLDRNLLADWLAHGAALTTEFALGLWVGPYPEEELANIAQLMDVMNQQPRGELKTADIQFTPERVRELQAASLSGGVESWTLYARERQTGELVGYTAVYFSPNRPEQMSQGDTGVFPAYRGRGLGRWLKAAMLDKALRERPEVQYVLTGNADSNAPMLKINHDLGFRPYLPQTIWQVDLETLLAYLHQAPSTS